MYADRACLCFSIDETGLTFNGVLIKNCTFCDATNRKVSMQSKNPGTSLYTVYILNYVSALLTTLI